MEVHLTGNTPVNLNEKHLQRVKPNGLTGEIPSNSGKTADRSKINGRVSC
jgi:hypothetical protein